MLKWLQDCVAVLASWMGQWVTTVWILQEISVFRVEEYFSSSIQGANTLESSKQTVLYQLFSLEPANSVPFSWFRPSRQENFRLWTPTDPLLLKLDLSRNLKPNKSLLRSLNSKRMHKSIFAMQFLKLSIFLMMCKDWSEFIYNQVLIVVKWTFPSVFVAQHFLLVEVGILLKILLLLGFSVDDC
jgi:hypothetical protein